MSSTALPLVSLPSAPAAEPRAFVDQVPRGRLVELRGGEGHASSGGRAPARYTTATQLVLRAQREGEPCVWIERADGHLYPPDLAQCGVDLEALTVLRIPPPDPHALAKAAELVLRSGGFGLVILDFTVGGAPHGDAWTSRLAQLARQHDAWLVVLTGPSGAGAATGAESQREAALGPLVSLRVTAERTRLGSGPHTIEHRVTKNKSGAPFDPAPSPVRPPRGAS